MSPSSGEPGDRGGGERRRVEAEFEELGDPETSPALPSAALAGVAALARGVASAFAPQTGTTREIWGLAWPVMLSQILVTIVGLVDIAMVGRIGPRAQAAVGYASQFFFLAQSALFAIGFACVAVMARAIGGGDPDRARAGLAASLLLSLLVGAALAVAISASPQTLLGWLDADPDVIADAVPYLRLVMGSSILFGAALTLESALRADRNTVTPMRIAVVVTATKVGLNAVLIFGLLGAPRLELVGAGIATVASQIVAVALLSWVALRAPRSSPLRLGPSDWTASRAIFRDLVRISLPGVAERLVMNLAMLAYFALLGRYGTEAVAAYTIGVRVLAFSWIPGVAYSQAVGTLVGQSLGAGDPATARRAGVRAASLALATAVTLGLVCALAREPLARLFTYDPGTIAALGPFMLCLAIAQPFLQVHFTLGGVHRGAGDTWTPLVAALVGNWAFRVPLAFVFAAVLGWDLVYVWSVILFDHVARAAWLVASFRRGRWADDRPPRRGRGAAKRGVG